MLGRLHAIAGGVSLAIITLFWSATLMSEMFAGPAGIVAVKVSIPWGFLLLVPALAAAGGSGSRLGRSRRGPLVEAKRRRMRLAALNGLLILAPSALFLAARAQDGLFGPTFYAVQAVELAVGAVNIALLGSNMRDGLRLSGRIGQKHP